MPDEGADIARSVAREALQLMRSMEAIHVDAMTRFLEHIHTVIGWAENASKTDVERNQWKRMKDECAAMESRMEDVKKDAGVSHGKTEKDKMFVCPVQKRGSRESEEYGQNILHILEQQGIPASFVHGFPEDIAREPGDKERGNLPYGYICTAMKRKEDVLEAYAAADLHAKSVTLTTSVKSLALASEYGQLIEAGDGHGLTQVQAAQLKREQEEWNRTHPDRKIPMCFTNDGRAFARQEDAGMFRIITYRTKERLEGRQAMDVAAAIKADRETQTRVTQAMTDRKGCVLADANDPRHAVVCMGKGFEEIKDGRQVLYMADPRRQPGYVSLTPERQEEETRRYVAARYARVKPFLGEAVVLDYSASKDARSGKLHNLGPQLSAQKLRWGIRPSLTPEQRDAGKMADYYRAYQEVLEADELDGELHDFAVSQSESILNEYASRSHLSRAAAEEELSRRDVRDIPESEQTNEMEQFGTTERTERPGRFTNSELHESREELEERERAEAGLSDSNDALTDVRYVDTRSMTRPVENTTPLDELPPLENEMDIGQVPDGRDEL